MTKMEISKNQEALLQARRFQSFVITSIFGKESRVSKLGSLAET